MVDTDKYNEWFVMAQKDLKGYLIAMTGALQEGHSLLKLCKKAMLQDRGFNVFLKDMALVNVFYIETRYPAVDPLIVSRQDTEECFRIVNAVLAKINELIAR